MSQKRLCVFCGSALPVRERYRGAASTLGRLIGEAGIELVYGGGRIGLMGLLADAALAAGTRVVGVIPIALHDREVAHRGLSELIVVPDMQERKRRMFELADGVAVLPGGLGTLDEAFEAITLRQLGMSRAPVALVNIDGYWDPLIALIDRTIENGFTRPEARALSPRCRGGGGDSRVLRADWACRAVTRRRLARAFARAKVRTAFRPPGNIKESATRRCKSVGSRNRLDEG